MANINTFDFDIVLDGEVLEELEGQNPVTLDKQEESEEVKETFKEKDDFEIILDETQDNKKTEVKEEEKAETSTDHSVSTALYQELIQKGIVKDAEKEEYSWDDIEGAIQSYKDELPDQVAESLVKQAPDKGKALIDFIFTKGDSLTDDDLKGFYQQYLEDLSYTSIVVDTEDKAREYLDNAYSKQGFKPSVRTAMIEALEDEGDLLNTAKDLAKKENDQNKSQQALSEAKNNKQEDKQAKAQFASDVLAELEKTEWTPQVVSEIKRQLASQQTWTILNQAANSPKAVLQLANLARFYNPENGSFNFDSFVKQAASKDIKSLKDKITQDMVSTGSNTHAKRERNKQTGSSLLDHLRPVI